METPTVIKDELQNFCKTEQLESEKHHNSEIKKANKIIIIESLTKSFKL